METGPEIQKIAFLGDYLPRKCGIATFTFDVLTAVAAVHSQSQCFAVPVNDIEGGYEYPKEVRFEIEEQDLASYHRTSNIKPLIHSIERESVVKVFKTRSGCRCRR